MKQKLDAMSTLAEQLWESQEPQAPLVQVVGISVSDPVKRPKAVSQRKATGRASRQVAESKLPAEPLSPELAYYARRKRLGTKRNLLKQTKSIRQSLKQEIIVGRHARPEVKEESKALLTGSFDIRASDKSRALRRPSQQGRVVRIEDPVVQGPVIEGPVIEGPGVEDRVIEDRIIENSVIERRDPLIGLDESDEHPVTLDSDSSFEK